MVFHRNNQRRRRVILDEAVQEAAHLVGDAVAPSASPKKKSETEPVPRQRAYSNGARRRNQLKTTDLIPKRPLAIAKLVGVLLGGLVLINALAYASQTWSPWIGSSANEMFRLGGTSGTLSNWFSSILLVLSGAASIQIYALRQHRCDDYRGAYRLWAWLALLFVIGSINCIVDFDSVGRELIAFFSDGPEQPWAIWVVLSVKCIALTALVIRGSFEVRASKGAMVAVIIVWLAYMSSIAFQIPAVQQEMVSEFEPAYGNCLLIGSVSLFLGLMTYARFVFLQANGLIPAASSVSANVTKVSTRSKSKAVRKSTKSRKKTVDTDSEMETAIESTDAKAEEAAPVESPTKSKRSLKRTTSSSRRSVTTKSKQPSKNQKTSTINDVATEEPELETLKINAASKAKPANEKMDAEIADQESGEDEQAEIISLTSKANLSKSEKRRLKKLQRRNRRAA